MPRLAAALRALGRRAPTRARGNSATRRRSRGRTRRSRRASFASPPGSSCASAAVARLTCATVARVRGLERPPSQSVARPVPGLQRAVHGHPRRDDRERRAAVDPGRPEHVGVGPAMGGQRLHAHVRRLPAARRARRRPPRPQTCLPRGRGRLHGRVVPERDRRLLDLPDRRPRPAGPRRGHDRPRGALDPDDDVPGGRAAHEGDGRLGRDRDRRRGRRAPPRRHPHRPLLLALDLLRQHPRGARRVPALPAVRAGIAGRCRAPRLRPPRRRHRHRRADRARLRDRQHRGGRLARGRARSGSACSPSRCSAPSSRSSAASGRRSSVSTSSACARCEPRT